MHKVLKKAVDDASYERSGSGQGVPTKKELAGLVQQVNQLMDKRRSSDDIMDAQHDLINALLVKLYG